MKKRYLLILIIILTFLYGCGGVIKTIVKTNATIEYTTAIHKDLISLPPPKKR